MILRPLRRPMCRNFLAWPTNRSPSAKSCQPTRRKPSAPVAIVRSIPLDLALRTLMLRVNGGPPESIGLKLEGIGRQTRPGKSMPPEPSTKARPSPIISNCAIELLNANQTSPAASPKPWSATPSAAPSASPTKAWHWRFWKRLGKSNIQLENLFMLWYRVRPS